MHKDTKLFLITYDVYYNQQDNLTDSILVKGNTTVDAINRFKKWYMVHEDSDLDSLVIQNVTSLKSLKDASI